MVVFEATVIALGAPLRCNDNTHKRDVLCTALH